jgi:tetratricopeptide (TPR) repeat protein
MKTFEAEQSTHRTVEITRIAVIGASKPLPTYSGSPASFWERAIGTLLGLVFLSAFALFLAVFIAQEHSHDLIVSGRKAYRNGDLALAEKNLLEAYCLLKPFSYHTYFGPCCYRLAKTYEAQGKWTQASLLFQQAVKHCNWSDSESGVDWAPAVFRSYCHLADIASKQGYVTSACLYYEDAESVVRNETNALEVEQARDRYLSLLKRVGKLDSNKLAQVKSSWQQGNARYTAFSEN